MSYPGACEKCGGDTGQDRIDVLVRELANLHVEMKGLEEKTVELEKVVVREVRKPCFKWLKPPPQ